MWRQEDQGLQASLVGELASKRKRKKQNKQNLRFEHSYIGGLATPVRWVL